MTANKKLIVVWLLLASLVTAAQKVSLVIPNGHAKNVEQIACTSDGKYIASIAYKTVMIWDVIHSKKIVEVTLDISLSASETNSISITDKLDKVAISTNSGLFCYNVQTGKPLYRVSEGHDGSAFSKDGKYLYASDYRTLYVYDANTGNIIRQYADALGDLTKGCKFFELADNRMLALHHYGWSVIDLVNGRLLFKKDLTRDEKLEQYDYSPALKNIVGITEQGIQMYDPIKGSLLKSQKTAYTPYGCVVANANKLVVFGNNYKSKALVTQVINLQDFSVLKQASQPFADVPEIIFYAEACVWLPGTSQVMYNNDRRINFFNIETGAFTDPFKNRITDFKQFYYRINTSQCLQADNQLTFATEDNTARILDMQTYKPGPVVDVPANVLFSPDGKLAAGIDKKITISNRQTGKIVKTVALPVTVDITREFFFFSFDNTQLVFTDRTNGGLNAININTGVVSKLVSMGSSYYACSSSYDGKYFACQVTYNKAEHLRIYNLQTKQVALSKLSCENNKPGECIGGIQFLNNSYYLFATRQQDNLAIFKADDPAYISAFKIQQNNGHKVLGGDIKNNVIAIGEIGQYQVGAYNIKLITKEGKLLKEFKSDNSADFLQVSFSEDQKLMFATTTQKGIQVFNTQTGEMLGTYYFVEKTGEYIFVTPEGLFDGSEAGMKELYFVQNNQPLPLEKLYEQFYTPDLLRRKLNGEKFFPPDVANLHPAPQVSIAYAAIQRNLEVTDDLPTYQNTTGAAEITVTATAPADAVDEIRLFHNGKIVNLVTRNLIVADDANSNTIKKYSIPLQPGLNSIRAVALNQQRTESSPDEIAVLYNSGNQPVNPKSETSRKGVPIAPVDKNATLYLIVVGINEYQNKSMSLNYALADATSFKEQVEKETRSVINNIQTYFITDTAANKPGIETAFKLVEQKAKAADVLLFYYAGHGVIGKDKQFYLVPTDVSNLSNVQAELEQKAVAARLLQQYAINIQAQKQLFILDACQSAGAFEAMLASNGNQQKSIAMLARSTGTHWMAASGAQQFANEFASLGHGIFTYVLLDALKGAAADGSMITVNSLKDYIEQKVPELMKQYNGTPQFPASYGFGNDFPVKIQR
jgi:WD40 repeat protein